MPAIKLRKKETNPVISVSAAESKTAWRFTNEDNGIGIAKEKFEKIFEIFTCLHTKYMKGRALAWLGAEK